MDLFDLEKVVSECREYSRQMAPKDLHHGFEHCLRVRRYAMVIGKLENADLGVVEISSYLHDIGRGHEKDGEYHTVTGARLADSFLKRFELPHEMIERVVRSIECHSRKDPFRKTPQTLEAKVLYDADGLEMIGAVGMLRIALSAISRNKGWKYILEKAKWRLTIIDDFLTPSGKMIAERRRKLVSGFIDQLLDELNENPASVNGSQSQPTSK